MPCFPSVPLVDNVSPAAPPANPFGTPFAPAGTPLTPSSGVPTGMPGCDALELMLSLSLPSLTLPVGIVLGVLDIHFQTDLLDVIMKLLDSLWPFIMGYQMLLPILRMIVCIIEVLCAISNPFALIAAIINLFLVCLPALLALFPILALIILILSLIYLLLHLTLYFNIQLSLFIGLLLNNIASLALAFAVSDEVGIMAILAKIGTIICFFQSLLAILTLFGAFFAIIAAILELLFDIPPCSGSSNCCLPQICPAWIKNNNSINAPTGILQYTSEVGFGPKPGSISGLPSGFNLTQIERNESWQFYDPFQTIFTQFQNINVAYDLPDGYSPTVYFPTSQTFTASTPPMQAPYTVDLTLFYEPVLWGQIDPKGPREIQITGCIVLTAPDGYYLDYANNEINEPTGVVNLAGGLAYEQNGTTPIMIDGYQATLNTLLHLQPTIGIVQPTLTPTGTATLTPISYSFNINHPILLQNALITLGCVPSVNAAKTFINSTYGNIAPKTAQVAALTLPDPAGAQACLSAAICTLAANVSTQGVATFQASTTACLNQLQDDANTAAAALIGIGFDPYTSTFTLTPDTQFTTLNINVQVSIMEPNGQLLTTGMPASLGPTIAQNITATNTFGSISPFVYDGYQYFNAQISSDAPGTGTITVSYQNQTISTVNTSVPSITPVQKSYTFIYAPLPVKTGVGDTDGQPRLGPGDIGGS